MTLTAQHKSQMAALRGWAIGQGKTLPARPSTCLDIIAQIATLGVLVGNPTAFTGGMVLTIRSGAVPTLVRGYTTVGTVVGSTGLLIVDQLPAGTVAGDFLCLEEINYATNPTV
jgi:hypothetical protein